MTLMLQESTLNSRIAVAAVVVATLAVLSCSDAGGRFEVEEVLPLDARLAPNESIVIRFSRELDAEAALSPLVSVRDEKGQVVATTASLSGRSLVLRPRDSWRWPPGQKLEVAVESGLALSLRSADGESLTRDFRRTLQVDEQFRDFGVPMTLDRVFEPPLTRAGRDATFVLEFSLPVDLEAARRAIRVTGPRGLRFAPGMAADGDPRRLVITPFSRQENFEGAARFALTLRAADLLAVTGRRLEGDDREWTFRTSPMTWREGRLEFAFRMGNVAATALPEGVEESEWARPLLSPLRAVTLHRDFTNMSAGARRTESRHPFSREPARLQIILPGSSLGADPGLVTGFSWFVVEAPQTPLLFPRLVMRIGEAADFVANDGLSPEFDANFAPYDETAQHRQLRIAASARDGSWTTRGLEWPEFTDDRARGWVAIRFDRPYFYRGGGRDLLLEIRNEMGAWPADPDGVLDDDFEGLAWAAGQPDGPFEGRSLSSYDAETFDRGHPSGQVFSTKIRIERYFDYISAWMATSLDDPEYFVLPTADQIDAEGVEGIDFRFEFQGRDADGIETSWGPLERLSGYRSIRSKLTFLPDSGRNARAPLEVRRLRVRYRPSR